MSIRFLFFQPGTIVFIGAALLSVVLLFLSSRGRASEDAETRTVLNAASRNLRAAAAVMLFLLLVAAVGPIVFSTEALRNEGLGDGGLGDGGIRLAPYIAPSIAAIAGLIVLAARSHRRSPDGDRAPVALLSVRRWWSFLSPPWLVLAAVSVGLLVATILLAGLASTPGTSGLYDNYDLHWTDDVFASIPFFGWYYGLPTLFSVAALLLVALVTLHRIARPPFSGDLAARALDATIRRLASRGVAALSVSAILTTLGRALAFVSAVATLEVTNVVEGGHLVTVVAPFAALTLPLALAGHLAQGIGLTLTLTLLLRPATLLPRPVQRSSRAGNTVGSAR